MKNLLLQNKVHVKYYIIMMDDKKYLYIIYMYQY